MIERRRTALAALPAALWTCLGIALTAVTLPAADRPAEEPRSLPDRYDRMLRPYLAPGGTSAADARSPRLEAMRATDGLPFQDLASAEIALDRDLPSSGGLDRSPVVLGGEGGAICVLAIENHTLRSLRSTDGGASFGPEIDVAGGPGAGAVLAFSADLAADGAVHVAMIVADPAGDRGLRHARGPDRCASWDPPTDVVVDGDPEHGLTAARIATGTSGFAAIAFVGRDGFAPYAVATVDGGANWTVPVRLDPGNGAAFVATSSIEVDVDSATDAIYVAYGQDRGAGSQIWTTRSTDDGATFAAEVNLDSVTPFKGESERPSVQVVEGGELLVAYWDITSGVRMFVAQSKDQGASFTSSYEENVGSDVARGTPIFCHVPGDSTIQLFWLIDDSLWHSRSSNNGDSFDDGSTLTVTGDADPDAWRPPARIGCAKTGNRAWIVGTSDFVDDTYAGTRTDVYVHRTTDDGVSWLPPERADTDAPASAESAFGGLVTTVEGDVFVAWSDRRDGTGREEHLYGNVHTAGVGFAGSDSRIDADAQTASAAVLREPAVATDGADGVYVAFSARGNGHEHDVWVARSADGGYSFAPAVRVSTTPAGARVQFAPYLTATPDGNVYLAYLSDDPVSGERQLRFNRSSNFGVTWQPADEVLDVFPHPVGTFLDSFDFPNVQLRAVSGGLVYVAWSDNGTVFLARSEDAGATFAIEDVDQDTRGYNRYPALCAQGDGVVLAIMSPDLAFSDFSVWGTASDDRGATWTTLQQLRSESTPERAIFPVVSCDGAGGAVVVWPDLRNFATWQLRANRWDGSAWQGDVPIDGPVGHDRFWPTVARAGASDVVVAFEDFDGAVYAARSVDGGATFPTHARLDDAAPDPDAFSETPRIAGDGDDLWVFWKDHGAGERAIVVRWSRDGGATWSDVRRVDRESPGGAFANDYYLINAAASALPDAAFLAWGGDRDDPGGDALVNVADLEDGDRDTYGSDADCDDADPAVWASPVTVDGLELAPIAGGVRLSWPSQGSTTGPGTVYDVATGTIADLVTSGSYSGATCLASDVSEAFHDDLRADPAPGTAVWHLVRARNSCGAGSYGDSGEDPDSRDDLDASGPCP